MWGAVTWPIVVLLSSVTLSRHVQKRYRIINAVLLGGCRSAYYLLKAWLRTCASLFSPEIWNSFTVASILALTELP